jgi:D-sedoheptulose 7-phosphate isomerase
VDSKRLDFIRAEFAESLNAMAAAARSEALANQMVAIASAIILSLQGGGKVLFAGNGGSAADAQHIAGEFVSRLNYDRAPLAGLALTTDTSVLTAVGNDYGYEHVFARQVAGLGKAGDTFVAISTSGRSENILAALSAARQNGLRTIGFTGSESGPMASSCDLMLNVPSTRTPMIQQLHITAAHIICGLVESTLFPK